MLFLIIPIPRLFQTYATFNISMFFHKAPYQDFIFTVNNFVASYHKKNVILKYFNHIFI